MKALETNKVVYDFLNFETLLRRYIAHPGDADIKKKIDRIILSVIAFENGKFQTNDYINPSEAYSLFFSSFDATDSNDELEELRKKISENNNDEDVMKFISRVLVNIENRNSDNLGNRNIDNYFVSWS